MRASSTPSRAPDGWWEQHPPRLIVSARDLHDVELAIKDVFGYITPSTEHRSLTESALATAVAGEGVILHRLGVAILPAAGVPDVQILNEKTAPARWTLEGPVFAASASWAGDDAQDPLELVGVGQSTASAAHIALLDTAVASDHPDLDINHSTSFVGSDEPGRHGTHSAGLIKGAATPTSGPRFGVAPAATLSCGAVLDANGVGRDSDVLVGLEWALSIGARVVVMPFAGRPRLRGIDDVFEEVAQRALAHGTLLVAAAGNHTPLPVLRSRPAGHPANCPSIIAVGATTPTGRDIARFSNGNATSGVDVVAPGSDLRSSDLHGNYDVSSGTSGAAAIAGAVAALHIAADPAAPASAIRRTLLTTAKDVDGGDGRSGAGLVQGPEMQAS